MALAPPVSLLRCVSPRVQIARLQHPGLPFKLHYSSPRNTRSYTLGTTTARSRRKNLSPHTDTMSPVPKTMKGVLTEKTGGVEVLEYRTDLPVPVPKEGEVLVKNEFIGINYIDTYFRTGLYPMALPAILGREAAGEVITPPHSTPSSNSTPLLAAGTRVVWMATGSYAEYSAVPAEACKPIPDNISSKDACAALLQGLTAITMIDESHKVNAGDWVLVHAAAGGVGGWLCQLLRARGAHTIATASTPEKREQAVRYGAEVCVGYADAVATVEEKTGGAGVIAVFDGVGKATWDDDLKVVARKGTVVSFGNASGPVEPFSIARLGAKNIKICRPMSGNYLVTREEKDKYVGELWEALSSAKIQVEVHDVYPLSDVQRATKDLEGRQTIGKLLLKP